MAPASIGRSLGCGRKRTGITPSDLTDEEWALISGLIPRAKRGGNKRTVDVREVVNGLMYVRSIGCQWRYIPKGLPPKSTVNGYFLLWNYDGTMDRIHHALYVKCRLVEDFGWTGSVEAFHAHRRNRAKNKAPPETTLSNVAEGILWNFFA